VSSNVPLVDEVLGMLHGFVFQVEWGETLSIEWESSVFKNFAESRALRKVVTLYPLIE
jgi:hypothetical protein